MSSAAATTSRRTAARRRPREQRRSSGLRRLLDQPAYRRVWLARTIRQIGDVGQFTTLALLLIALTGSGLGVSGAVLAEIAPVLLLALLAGSIVDRLPRVKVMVAAALVRVGLAATLAFWHDSTARVRRRVRPVRRAGVLLPRGAVPAAVHGRRRRTCHRQQRHLDRRRDRADRRRPIAALLAVNAGFGPALAVNAVSFALQRRRPARAARTRTDPSGVGHQRVRTRPRGSGRARPDPIPLLKALAAGQFLAALSARSHQRAARRSLTGPARRRRGLRAANRLHRARRARHSGCSGSCAGSPTHADPCSRSASTRSAGSSTSSWPPSPHCHWPQQRWSFTACPPAPVPSPSAPSSSPVSQKTYEAGRSRASTCSLRGRTISQLDRGLLADAVGIQAVYLLGGLLLLAAAAVGALGARSATR